MRQQRETFCLSWISEMGEKQVICVKVESVLEMNMKPVLSFLK